MKAALNQVINETFTFANLPTSTSFIFANKGNAVSPIVKGRLIIIVAAVMWSTSGLFAKAPILDAWPTELRGTLLAFWRAVFAGGLLLPFAKRMTWTWKLVPATLAFVVMNVTYLTAMSKTTAANAIWLQSTSPIWVFLLGICFLSQEIKRSDWMMLLFTCAGVGVIIVGELGSTDTSSGSREGALWALSSGVALAIVVLSLTTLRDLDSIWLISIYHLVTAALLLPLILSFRIWPDVRQLGWLALFGTLQMGIPYVLLAKALHFIPSHEAAFLLLVEPILVPVWVWLAWRSHPGYEAPMWWTFLGAALILIGLIFRFSIANWQATGVTKPL